MTPLTGAPRRRAPCSSSSSETSRQVARRGGSAARPPAATDDDQGDAAAPGRELAETVGYVQTLVQEYDAANELQTSNEEALSANEELQSINEELQTAKEEVQSANEELVTLNQELQGAGTFRLGPRARLRERDRGDGARSAARSWTPTCGWKGPIGPSTTTSGSRPRRRSAGSVYELGDGQWDIPGAADGAGGDPAQGRPARGLRGGARVPADRPPDLGAQCAASSMRDERGQESILLAIEDRTEVRRAEQGARGAAGHGAASARAGRAGRPYQGRVRGHTSPTSCAGRSRAMVGWVHVLRGGGMGDATIRERGTGRHRARRQRADPAHRATCSTTRGWSRARLPLVPRLMDVLPVAEAAIGAVRSAAEAKGHQARAGDRSEACHASTAIPTGCNRSSGISFPTR